MRVLWYRRRSEQVLAVLKSKLPSALIAAHSRVIDRSIRNAQTLPQPDAKHTPGPHPRDRVGRGKVTSSQTALLLDTTSHSFTVEEPAPSLPQSHLLIYHQHRQLEWSEPLYPLRRL